MIEIWQKFHFLCLENVVIYRATKENYQQFRSPQGASTTGKFMTLRAKINFVLAKIFNLIYYLKMSYRL